LQQTIPTNSPVSLSTWQWFIVFALLGDFVGQRGIDSGDFLNRPVLMEHRFLRFGLVTTYLVQL
jgi:hypothetical protein